MVSHARSKTWEDERPTEPSSDAKLRPVDLEYERFSRKRPSRGNRALRAFARFLITFCIGVAATLAWQSYGDAAREMIAESYPQLGWLTPQAARPAQPTPAAVSPELLQLKATQLGLTLVQQKVDQLAAQFSASQQQTAGDIAALQTAAQDILHKISAPPPRPPAAPARKPVPLAPPQQSAAPPEQAAAPPPARPQ